MVFKWWYGLLRAIVAVHNLHICERLNTYCTCFVLRKGGTAIRSCRFHSCEWNPSELQWETLTWIMDKNKFFKQEFRKMLKVKEDVIDAGKSRFVQNQSLLCCLVLMKLKHTIPGRDLKTKGLWKFTLDSATLQNWYEYQDFWASWNFRTSQLVNASRYLWRAMA